MKFNNRENTCHIIDGRQVWETRSSAVHGIIMLSTPEDNYLLLTRRSDKCPDEQGKLANVTGYLDWDETLQEALTRELWEEVGLDLRQLITKGQLVCGSWATPRHVDSIPKGRQNVTVRFEMGFRVDALPPLTPSDEVTMAEFVPISDVEEALKFPVVFAWDHDIIIRHAILRFKTALLKGGNK